MQVKVFIVFHRAIDERQLLSLFTPAEVESHFTLYGVNAAHPDKIVTRLDGRTETVGPETPNVLLEYQLPRHTPELQARGFMEASCYVHLHQNALHKPLDYIGIAQYDMRWTLSAVALLRDLVNLPPGGRNTVYGIICGKIMNAQGQLNTLTFPRLCNWPFLFESYNRFFKRNWDASMLIDKPFTLYQTYLMPRNHFADLASWLAVLCEELWPWANQPPYPTHWGHVAGLAERAESLFIAARLAEGAFTIEPLPVHHDESIHHTLKVSKDHYGSKPTA